MDDPETSLVDQNARFSQHSSPLLNAVLAREHRFFIHLASGTVEFDGKKVMRYVR